MANTFLATGENAKFLRDRGNTYSQRGLPKNQIYKAKRVFFYKVIANEPAEGRREAGEAAAL